ncbi:hypothetical protein CRG98_015877 [Punica granatum]|uniref:Uncharacterized protein n=1 Tax=Punica granatum TaxID=22663 RepID=A0A2I0K7V0_PUNGR|nr:hypothetical protein CRG98_015877 [Punica granatum]
MTTMETEKMTERRGKETEKVTAGSEEGGRLFRQPQREEEGRLSLRPTRPFSSGPAVIIFCPFRLLTPSPARLLLGKFYGAIKFSCSWIARPTRKTEKAGDPMARGGSSTVS